MLGYVASFLALISLLANSGAGSCGHCLPCHLSSPGALRASSGTKDGMAADCCHSEEKAESCDEHDPIEGDRIASRACPHSPAPGGPCSPCRPGRCVHATVSTGIAPQSVSPEWVWCRSLTAISDLSEPAESCSLFSRDPGDGCDFPSASLFRAMTQVWLI